MNKPHSLGIGSVWHKFINHEKFQICDLDLMVSEEVGVGVGMEQQKILDQYLTSGKVSFKGSRDIHF